MFLKKVAYTLLLGALTIQSTSLGKNLPTTRLDSIEDNSIEDNSIGGHSIGINSVSEELSSTLRGLENKAFKNLRVYNTLHTNDLYVEENTVIGGNLKVNGTFSGGGFVTGPGSSTPNAIATFSDASGSALTNSPVTINTTGNMADVNDLAMTGDLTGAVNITMAGGDLSGVNNVFMNGGKLTGVTNITMAGNLTGAQNIDLSKNLNVGQDASISGTLFIGAIANIDSPTAAVTWPLTAGTAGQFLGSDGAGNLSFITPAGGGDVSSAGNFTVDNKIVLTDVSSGPKFVKESTNVTIDSSDTISGVFALTATTVNATMVTSTTVNATELIGHLTGNVTGNADTATSAITSTTSTFAINALSALTSTSSTYFTGSLFGDVTGLQSTTSVAFVGGKSSADVAAAVTDVQLSTTVNTPNTLVRRSATGAFAAGTITATLEGNATTATTAGTATNFSGLLNGDVVGSQVLTTVTAVGGKTAPQVATSVNDTIAATNSNTPPYGTIVKRDLVDGGFSAGTITASFSGPLSGTVTGALIGNASTATSATSFSGSLAGDVSGTQGATVVNKVGGKLATDIATSVTTTQNATSANTFDTLVKRDGSGNFAGSTITATQFNGPLTGNVIGDVTGNLTGQATSAVMSDTAQWFSVSLAGDITGPQLATVVAAVGNKTTAQVVQSVDDTIAATPNNTADTIVKRDNNSHFIVDKITINNPPTADADATNKEYVDSLVGLGLTPKAPVIATSIINTPTAGLQTIDGIIPPVSSRVLLTNQSYTLDNGLWLVQDPSNWLRPDDFLNTTTAGQAYVLTLSGNSLAGTGWLCSTPLAVVGTDTVTFVQFTSPGQTTAANVGTGVGEVFRDKTGLTLNFKTLAGENVIPAATGKFVTITNGANELTFAVTATSDNTANTLVARDGSGNFKASTITAALTGAASDNVLKAGDTMTGNLIMAPSAGPTRSQINWRDNAGTNYVGIRAPATVGTSYQVALPTDAPTAGQFLRALTSGLNATLTWTTADAPPAATETIYVAINGDDANDGSFSAPLRHVSAAVTMAKSLASPTTPVTISIGAGTFVETSAIPLIDVPGISIEGSTLASTILIQNNANPSFFTADNADIMFSNLILRNTIGSTSTAIAINAPDFGRTRLNNVGMSLFNTGVAYNGTDGLPYMFIENLQVTDINTILNLSDVQTVIKSCSLQGSSTGIPINTGFIITGTSSQTAIFNSYFASFDTAIAINNKAHQRILGCNFENIINSINCTGGSTTQVIGSNFIHNYPSSINVSASGISAGTNTKVYLEGCLFDCEDKNDISQGLAIKVTDQAQAVISACTIEKAFVGIQCGAPGDLDTTEVIASGLNIIESTTCINQLGSSKLEFVAGSFDADTTFIADPTNVSLTGFNVNGIAPLAIGKTNDVFSTVYELLTGQNSLPHLSYEPNYYGHKGTIYHNPSPNNNPTFSGVQSDLNDAAYYVVTGNNTKEACLHLISDTNNISDPMNVRGWDICKRGNTAELAFTFTNNDPGQANCGPYTVMQLNGFDNQVEFPTATGTLPTNLTAKLVWGGEPNTNLYRNGIETLKTDANFIVGGNLTASSISSGSTFISTLTLAAGSAANPSLQFLGSSNTGLSAATPNRLSFDTNGTERMSIDGAGTIAINAFAPAAGVVHNALTTGALSSSFIVNADIVDNSITGTKIQDGTIGDIKLATITTAGKVSNSATTADSALIPDTIVLRDGSGNFLANIITATLQGNAATATSALTSTTATYAINALSALTSTSSTYFTGSLFGDVTGLQSTTSVAFVGGKSSAEVAAATTDVQLSTTVNTPNTLVRRGATGDFAAGIITATLQGNAATATSAITSTTATYFTGSLFGDVTGLQSTTSVAFVGGKSSAEVAAATTDVQLSTTVNTPNTLVRRGATGDFAAGIITATLLGNATTATSAITSTSSTYFTGSLFGDVTGLQSTTSVAFIGGKSSTEVAAATTDVQLSTTVNTPNTLVRRNASGSFAAGMITASLTGMVTGTASFNVLKIGDIMTGNLTLPPGTTSAPSLNFTGGTTTGISMPSINTLSFDTNGVERMSIDSTGTVAITQFTATGIVHNAAITGALSSSLIVNADISASAGIVDTKLATISTAGKVLDSATTATSANIFDTIVKRDTLGNFAATVITARLTGTASENILRSGDSMTGTFTVIAGTATNPSLQFAGSTNTGFSAQTTNRLSFDTNGVERMSIDSTGTAEIYGTLVLAAGTATSPSLKFTNGTNTGLSSATANKISFDISAIEKMNIDASTIIATTTFISAAACIMAQQACLGGIQVDASNNTSVTVADSTSILLKIPSGNVANYAITMPTSPIHGQLLTIVVGHPTFQVNGITYTGTVVNGVTRLRPGTNMTATTDGASITFIYNSATTTWYRCARS